MISKHLCIERGATNVEHVICDHNGNNWSHRHGNKRFKQKFETTTGKHSIDSVHKTATLGTSHITQKVLQGEVWALNGGDRRWFRRRSAGEKRRVTRDNKIINIIIIICHVSAIIYTVQRDAFCDHVCPSVTEYQRLNRPSNFHDIRCGSCEQNVVEEGRKLAQSQSQFAAVSTG